MGVQYKDPRLDYKYWCKITIDYLTGCWIWSKPRDKDGYGRVYYLDDKGVRRFTGAHRYVYSILVEDPGSLHVLHYCDNPPCCNPQHLRTGTNADNVRDRDRRGPLPHPKGKTQSKRRKLAVKR